MKLQVVVARLKIKAVAVSMTRKKKVVLLVKRLC